MRSVAALALLLAACAEPPSPSRAVDAAQPAVTRAVTVIAVSGRVDRINAAGQAQRLSLGDKLQPDDSVRTDEDGAAALDVVGMAEVQVAPGTHVAVGELTSTLSRMKLRDGRISAVVHGAGDQKLQVEVPAAGAVAQAGKGEFSMLAAGEQVAVATRAGEVKLAAHGHEVRIGAGQISLVQRDHAPSAPAAVPASLYLKVGPINKVQREKVTTVHGTTVPGAVISVGGVRVTSGTGGEFVATVPLKDGSNHLVVQSADVMGRTQRTELPRITVDSRAPDAKTKVQW